jgi:hypothetical protein
MRIISKFKDCYDSLTLLTAGSMNPQFTTGALPTEKNSCTVKGLLKVISPDDKFDYRYFYKYLVK